MPNGSSPSRRRAADAERSHRAAPPRPRGRPRWGRPAGALLLAALFGAGIAPAFLGGALAGPAAPPHGTAWAWGASTTVTLGVHEIGAFNSSTPGAGPNLTVAGAYVDLSVSITAREASFAIVQATSASPGNVSLQVEEAQFQGIALNESIAGSLPVAGSYAPNASIPLANQTASVALAEGVLQVAVAFLNYTVGPSGTTALANEHLQFARFVNLSLTAQHFPNVTANAQGGPVIRYDTGAVRARGFEGVNLTGTFAPGLVLVQRPLTNASRWSQTVQADWNGTVAYGATIDASAPGGGHARSTQGASARFQRSGALNLSAASNGTVSVLNPNGTRTNETDIVYTLSAPGGGAQVVDGLFVLPSANATATSTGVAEMVPEHPASAPTAAGPTTSALVPSGASYATGSVATTSTGTAVVATPMSPDDARASMAQLEASTSAPLGPDGGPTPDFAGVLLVACAAIVGLVVIRRDLRKVR